MSKLFYLMMMCLNAMCNQFSEVLLTYFFSMNCAIKRKKAILYKKVCFMLLSLSLCVRKPASRVLTKSDKNRAVQSQMMARGCKFWI